MLSRQHLPLGLYFTPSIAHSLTAYWSTALPNETVQPRSLIWKKHDLEEMTRPFPLHHQAAAWGTQQQTHLQSPEVSLMKETETGGCCPWVLLVGPAQNNGMSGMEQPRQPA